VTSPDQGLSSSGEREDQEPGNEVEKIIVWFYIERWWKENFIIISRYISSSSSTEFDEWHCDPDDQTDRYVISFVVSQHLWI
jgi:hypothetical protein